MSETSQASNEDVFYPNETNNADDAQTDQVQVEQKAEETQVDAVAPTEESKEEAKPSAPSEESETTLASPEQDSEKPEEAKEDEGTDKQATEKEQVVYDLKLPEESALGDQHLEAVQALAEKHDLPNEVAQALVERDNEMLKEWSSWKDEQDAAELKSTSESWVAEVKEDAELGGENFQQTINNAQKVVREFASEKLVEELNATRLGDHPELIRFLSRIGSRMQSDSLVFGNAQAAPAEKNLEDYFYPSQKA